MRLFNTVLGLFAVLGTLSLQGQFVAERSISENEVTINNQQMNLRVIDANTKELLPSNLRVSGLNPRKPVELNAVADTTLEIKNYRIYSVTCVKEGYMLYADKFWPDESTMHEQLIPLQPLQIGLKTDLRDIVFLGDKTEIYHKSKPALADLIAFLEVNKNVQIAIIGHVNGPDNERSQRVYQKASIDRARSVRDYLVENGINEDRLEIRGAGNTQMIYPNPETEWQNEANRRIEIEIIGL